MTSYPDTSFLCALYRPQFNSVLAAEYFSKMKEPLHVASPLVFEFRQSLRLQVFLHTRDPGKGFTQREASAALAKFDENLADGFLQAVPVDWPDVVSLADRLSVRHTPKEGTKIHGVGGRTESSLLGSLSLCALRTRLARYSLGFPPLWFSFPNFFPSPRLSTFDARLCYPPSSSPVFHSSFFILLSSPLSPHLHVVTIQPF